MTQGLENGHKFQILRSATDASGSRGERMEEAIRGDLTIFLQNTFFVGAVEQGVMTDRDAKNLPEAVNDILTSVFEKTDEPKLFSELLVLSSVAREIAWSNITGGLPESFWLHYRHIQELRTHLLQSQNEAVRAYADSFRETNIDLDVMLSSAENTSMLDIGRRIASRFGVPQKDIHSENNYLQESFRFKWGAYTIKVLSGSSPTAAIDLVKIYFLDQDTEQEKYHIDITKSGMLSDKRAGVTTGWQDSIAARLTPFDGRLQYTMSEDSASVMYGQDSINAEKIDSAEAFLEISLRSFLRVFMHRYVEGGVEKVRLANGNWLTLPDFSMMLPVIASATESSDSLFGLRRRIRELVLKNQATLPYDNEQYMHLIQRELHLCFQIDPYLTVQALRDSGIALLIPGLRELSDTDWNKILQSLEFMMDLAERGTGYPKANERTFEMMAQQRELYLGNRGGEHYFDGLERFMRALGAKKSSEWEAYLALWEKPQGLIIEGLTDISRDQFGPMITYFPLKAKDGSTYILTTPEGTINQGEIEVFFDALRKERELYTERTLRDWRDRVDVALRKIDGNSHDERISQSFAQKRILKKAPELLHSIGTVAAILQLAPSALTAKEVDTIYMSLNDEYHVLPFSQALYRLKLTGAVRRIESKRVNKHGVIVPMMLYNWQNLHMRTDLSNIYEQRKLLPYYEYAAGKIGEQQIDTMGELKEILNQLAIYQIHTREVIAALLPEEDCQHMPESLRGSLAADINILQQAFKKQLEESDEW